MPEKLERWLFVCSGNICRSPFAEAAARHLSADPRLEFTSAGTIAIPGNPATRAGIEAAADLGIDLGSHRATHLTRDVVAGADRVLAMEREHLAEVLELVPEATVELLEPNGGPIPDPYGGDHAEYTASYELILISLRRHLV